MSIILQLFLILGSIWFFLFIISMIKKKKLELKYALTWIVASFLFIILSLFPGILYSISALLHIETPVNALFLLTIFFLLIIIFTLTIALSKSSNRIAALTQEIGILKLEHDKLKNQIRGDSN